MLVFFSFFKSFFSALFFSIYLIWDWACIFFICFLLDFSLILKWYKLYHPLTLDCLIINLHSFIQFSFDEITPASQPGRWSCMLTRMDSSRVLFDLFCIIFFSSIRSFNILYAAKWALNVFHFIFYEVITFSFNSFLHYQIRSFNILFFLKLIFYFSFIF